jgi:predicted nucleic acid-binding protein
MKALAQFDPEFVVWWATGTECVSALSRRLRATQIGQIVHDTGMSRLAAARAQWTEFPPTERLRDSAERLLRAYPLRTADALQLAAALEVASGSPRTLPFVCLDDRLREAARNEGFTVEP